MRLQRNAINSCISFNWEMFLSFWPPVFIGSGLRRHFLHGRKLILPPSPPPPPLPDPLHRIQLDGSKHTGDLSSIPSISNIQLKLKLNLILAPIRLKTGHLNATGATGIRNPESV